MKKNNYSMKLFQILNTINQEKHLNSTNSKKLKLPYSKNFIKNKMKVRNLAKHQSLNKNSILNSKIDKKITFEKKSNLKKTKKKNIIKNQLKNNLWEIKKLKYSGQLIKREMCKIKKIYIDFDKKIKKDFSELNTKSKYNNLLRTEKDANSLLNLSLLPKIIKNNKFENIKNNIKKKLNNFKNLQNVDKRIINKKFNLKLSKFSNFLIKNKISKKNLKNFPKKSYDKKHSKEFILACKLGQKSKIKEFLKINKFLVYEFDYFNMTGLHWSVKRGHHEIISLLLENRSYYAFKDINDRTPIYYAIENKDPISLYKLFFYCQSSLDFLFNLKLYSAKFSGQNDIDIERFKKIAVFFYSCNSKDEFVKYFNKVFS